jgi:hypothetical protein
MLGLRRGRDVRRERGLASPGAGRAEVYLTGPLEPGLLASERPPTVGRSDAQPCLHSDHAEA